MQAVAKGLQRQADGLKGLAGGRQCHVLRIVAQGLARCLPMLLSNAQLLVRLIEPLSGGLEFAPAGGGLQMRCTQGVVGRRGLPISCSLVLRLRQCGEALRQHGLVLCQHDQALGDLLQPPRPGGGPCGVADEVCAGFVPRAGQSAQPESPIRGQPSLGARVVLGAAGHAGEQALQQGCWNGGRCALSRHGRQQPIGQRWRQRP